MSHLQVNVVAAIIYTTLFFLTAAQSPFVGDDSLLALLDTHPRVVTGFDSDRMPIISKTPNLPPIWSITAGDDLRLPILFQHRQGGIGFWPVIALAQLFEPVDAIIIHHFLTGLIALLLIGTLARLALPDLAAKSTIIFLSFDPVQILGFGPFISEPWMRILFITLLIALYSNGTRSGLLLGTSLGLGFLVKISFLWYTVAALPFVQRKALGMKLRQAALPISIAGLLSLSMFDLSGLLTERASEQGHLIKHSALAAFSSLFGDRRAFLAYLYNDQEITQSSPETAALFWCVPGLLSILAILMSFNAQTEDGAPSREFGLRSIASALLFYVAIVCSLPGAIHYAQYFTKIHFLLTFIIVASIFSVARTKRTLFAITVIALPLANTALFYKQSVEAKPVSQINGTLHRQVIEQLRDTKSTLIFTSSYADIATYEHVSGGDIAPYNLYEWIREAEPDSLTSLLQQLNSGTLIINPRDQHSWHFWTWGPDKFEQQLAEADKVLHIMQKTFIDNNKGRGTWLITFSER